jgi:hypothetical protein
MQHMDERALLARDPHQPLRRAERRLDVAPHRMRSGIAGNAQDLRDSIDLRPL